DETKETSPSGSAEEKEEKEEVAPVVDNLTAAPSCSKDPIVPKNESPTPNSVILPSMVVTAELPQQTQQQPNTESYSQSESLSVDSNAYLQASGEDLEVENILASTEAAKEEVNEIEIKSESDSESPQNPTLENSMPSSVLSNESSKKEQEEQ